MTRPGPRPTPLAIHVAAGTYRRARHGSPDTHPAFPPLASADPPCTLGDAGRARWLAIVPALVDTGVLTAADLPALELYCRSFDEVARLDALLAEAGEFITTRTGFTAPHPAMTQRFKWLDLQRRLACEFALTPSSRTSVRVAPSRPSGIVARPRVRDGGGADHA